MLLLPTTKQSGVVFPRRLSYRTFPSGARMTSTITPTRMMINSPSSWAWSTSLIPSHRDMSLVSCNDCASIIIGYPANQQCFPVRLHNLLSDSARHQASCMWLPHGRAFVITDMAQFVLNIIPQLFVNNTTTNQYSTFMDSMESYGFQQASYFGLPAFYHKVRRNEKRCCV
jgi:hypothetical protein